MKREFTTEGIGKVLMGVPAGNGSSFDSLLAADTASAGNTGTAPSNDSTNTNQEGNAALLKNLITTLGASATSSAEESTTPDFSTLFADTEAATASAPAPAPTAAPAPAPAQEQTTAQSPAPAETTFLDQLSDDTVMAGLVNGIVPAAIQLPQELQGLFGAGDEAVNSIELTQEGLAAIVSHTTAMAARQSMSNSINLLRELVPALTTEAEKAALGKVNQSRQMEIAIAELGGNKQLEQLAHKLAANKNISDGKEFAKQIKSLMHTINSNEISTQQAARPQAQPSTKQFLQSI